MRSNRLLFVDEQRFGKICSALANQNGYQSDWVPGGLDDLSKLDFGCYDLVITSYPYGRQVLNLLAEKGRVLLVLADYACDELTTALANQAHCFYAVKPLDFSRFGHLLKNILGDKVK